MTDIWDDFLEIIGLARIGRIDAVIRDHTSERAALRKRISMLENAIEITRKRLASESAELGRYKD